MCLAIPSKIISINEAENTARVDTMGTVREARLDLMDEKVEIGDYILLHIGFAMKKIDEESAKESLKIYDEILSDLD